jgi:hypothetical protein
MSAFWEGGRDALELVMVFIKSRQRARVNRIGCTVKVYRKESKQRINPNDIIFKRCLMDTVRQAIPKALTFSIATGMERKLLTRSHFNS